MAMFQSCLEANKAYAAGFRLGGLAMPPAKGLAVVACMDARLTVEQFLGLKTGDAHIIRNAGGLVTDDALRSLIISQTLLGTREIFVINHTDCGMLTFTDGALKARLKKERGADPGALRFYPFKDLEANVRTQVRKLRRSPFILKETAIHGLIYQVEDGRLRVVE